MLTKYKLMMKNISLILMIVAGAIVTSCTFTEKISIEEDGTGHYELDSDMSGAMSFMTGFAKGMSEDEEGATETKSDKLSEFMDTTINFNDVLLSLEDDEELTEEKKEILRSLKDAKMKTFLDAENGKMLMTFMFDFEKISDLQNVQKKVSSAYKMSGKDDMSFSTTPNSTSYEYSSKSFKRIVSSNKLSKKEKSEYDNGLEKMKMFFSGSFYKIEYNFPTQIKKCSVKDATFSDDRKTVYITYPFEDVIENESALDFEITF